MWSSVSILSNDVIRLSGWIDQSRVLTIPSFLGTEFATAEGMRGATNDEWTDYKNMFSRSVRHVNFDLVQGPPGWYSLDCCLQL